MSVQQLGALTVGSLVERAHFTIRLTPQCAPAPSTRHLPFIQRDMAIDQHETYTISSEFGFFKCRAILDLAWVKEDQIGR